VFVEIDIASLELNPFTAFEIDNLLITAGTEGNWNTMTAAWGFLGVMWSKPTFGIVVRDSRYTFEFLEKYNQFTCSFFPPSFRKALQFCGSHSGRDTDKAQATGLTAVTIEGNNNEDFVTFEQANMVYCCTKASKTNIDPADFIDTSISRHYPKKDYHTLYLGYIDRVLVQEI